MQVSPITTASNLFARHNRKRQAYPVIPEEKQTVPIAYWNGRGHVSFVA